MSGPRATDPPTRADAIRARRARRFARCALAEAEQAMAAASLAAYRADIGLTVRSASPVLDALLHHAGTSLDEAAWKLRPPPF